MSNEIEVGDLVVCHSNHEPWEGAEVLAIQDGYATLALDGDVFEEAVANLRSDSRKFSQGAVTCWVD